MKPVAGLLVGLMLGLLVAGCVDEGVGNALPDRPGPPGKSLGKAARAECVMRGGATGRGGIMQDEICIRPTIDAGKACTDNDQCETFCLAETKACAPLTPMFGCFATLKDGAETPMLCVD
jgi:hypothetical protein